MKKIPLFIVMIVTLLFEYASVSADSDNPGFFCLKEKNCQKGDVIFLEFSRVSKDSVAQKVAKICNFENKIFTHSASKDKHYIACVFIGKKRALRK